MAEEAHCSVVAGSAGHPVVARVVVHIVAGSSEHLVVAGSAGQSVAARVVVRIVAGSSEQLPRAVRQAIVEASELHSVPEKGIEGFGILEVQSVAEAELTEYRPRVGMGGVEAPRAGGWGEVQWLVVRSAEVAELRSGPEMGMQAPAEATAEC